MIIKMTITFDYNPETNEYKPIKQEVVKETPTPKKVEDNGEAKLQLLDNKYELNGSAINLLGINVGDRVDIKYQMVDGIKYPIIGSSNAWKSASGNKLTKSNTIACRGSKNEELSKYGKEFVLAAHPSKAGLFVLTSEEVAVDQLVGDDNVNIDTPEGIDLNLEGLVDDKDANVSSIDTNFFKL